MYFFLSEEKAKVIKQYTANATFWENNGGESVSQPVTLAKTNTEE